MKLGYLLSILFLFTVAVEADVIIGTPDGTENLFCAS